MPSALRMDAPIPKTMNAALNRISKLGAWKNLAIGEVSRVFYGVSSTDLKCSPFQKCIYNLSMITFDEVQKHEQRIYWNNYPD